VSDPNEKRDVLFVVDVRVTPKTLFRCDIEPEFLYESDVRGQGITRVDQDNTDTLRLGV
jgi:hypothetical protein